MGETVDHIPPRSFFPTPPPPDLITVPCCECCRIDDQKNDRFVRNLFTSFVETEVHPAVADHLAARRDKSFYEDRSMVAKLTSIMKMAEVHDAAGRVVGRAPAFNLSDPRVHRFVERVARGVLFAAFKETYFIAKFDWVLQPGIPDAMFAMAPAPAVHRKVGDIFEFLATPRDPNARAYVILVFYQNLQLMAEFRA
jgi:hypothetical protein